MQMFENLPWCGYVLAAIGAVSYIYKLVTKGKEGYDEPDLANVKFRKDPNSNLNAAQLFSLSLDAVTTEWRKANTNI